MKKLDFIGYAIVLLAGGLFMSLGGVHPLVIMGSALIAVATVEIMGWDHK